MINSQPTYANHAAEQEILSAIVHGISDFDTVQAEGLQAEHFHQPSSGTVYGVCERLRLQGKSIDHSNILAEMSAQEMRDVGGIDALALRTASNEFSHDDLPAKARLVMELCRIRQAMWEIQLASQPQAEPISARSLQDALERASSILTGKAASDVKSGSDAIREALRRVSGIVSGDEVALVPTGFPSLDMLIGGWRPGSIYGIGGHPKAGKTQVGLATAVHAANCGWGVLYLSLEMLAEDIIERVAGWRSTELAARLQACTYDERTQALLGSCAREALANPGRLWIADDSDGSRRSVESLVTRMARIAGVRLVVIDYLTLLQEPPGREPQAVKIAKMTRYLKVLAQRTKVAIVLLAQYNRNAFGRDDSRPRPSDIYGSGALEKDCAALSLLHTPWIVKREKPGSWAELHVAANRFGDVGEVALRRTTVGEYIDDGLVTGEDDDE